MKIIQKITAVFLALVCLLSSLGFTVNKISCLKTGQAKFSFVTIKDCCAQIQSNDACCDNDDKKIETTSQTRFTTTDCCDITNSNFDLSDFKFGNKNHTPSASHIALIALPNILFSNLENHATKTNILFDSPHLLHGRALLFHISSLLI